MTDLETSLSADLDARHATPDPANFRRPPGEPLPIGYYGLPEATYHADPCEVPSLSASIAKILATQSPAHAWLAHPRLGAEPRKPSKTLDWGKLIHALVLGVGGPVEIIEAADYTKKVAQEARDAAYDAGKTPVTAPQYLKATRAAKEIRKRTEDWGIDLWSVGRRELAMVWRTDGVLCRGMMDFCNIDAGVIWDLKTAQSAAPPDIDKHMYEYGYDVQWAAYVEGFEELCDSLKGRTKMGFLYAETEPPYAVTPVYVTGTMSELGIARWTRAKGVWKRCLATNEWPTYVRPGQYHYAEAPRWALQREGVEI